MKEFLTVFECRLKTDKN